MKQLKLFKPNNLSFGGELLLQKRKSARPLSVKAPIHLVLRGDISRSGSLLKYRRFIESELRKWSEHFNIKIYDQALCSNHIHLCLKLTTLEGYRNFARVIAGRFAFKLKIKWMLRPFTRIVSWGRAFKALQKYILQNHEEAIGLRIYKPRGPPK
jgi:REP element-mobilizing transposase RayT